MTERKKILVVTRKYPPIKGGMEIYSYDLYNSLKKEIPCDLIANTKGNKFLLFFIINLFFKMFILRKKYEYIHFTDGVLSPFAYLYKIFTKSKVSITIHALDITYKNFIYQKTIPFFLKRLDKIVCVSNFSINECVKRGVNKSKCLFIPNGINYVESVKDDYYTKKDLFERFNFNFKDKKILFTVGRQVKRKGSAWFLNEVLPNLREDIVYVLGGTGPAIPEIKKAIERNNLENRVLLLGWVDDKTKYSFYKYCNLFIMPNIKVKGDPEGFGIVLIEAVDKGSLVLASKIEGMKDAIIEGKTGFFAKSGDVRDYLNKINDLLDKKIDKKELIKYNKEYFDWSILAKRYVLEVFI